MASELPVSVKKCTCDDKFILFMKSELFEGILKDAMQNVMGDIIRNILKHQISEDLRIIIEKIEKIETELKCVKHRNDVIKGEYENQDQETCEDQYEDLESTDQREDTVLSENDCKRGKKDISSSK